MDKYFTFENYSLLINEVEDMNEEILATSITYEIFKETDLVVEGGAIVRFWNIS